jgi:hypothetical protein
MNTFKRSLSLLFLSAVLMTAASPMMAACRIDSKLDINQIIDPTLTTLKRVDSKNFLVFFAVNSNKFVFRCGVAPAGCTQDGITFKPALSSNVAAANQTAECRAFQITATNSGVVVAGFRIRFEQGLTPSRKTFNLTFDTRDPNLKFTLTSVPEPTDATD